MADIDLDQPVSMTKREAIRKARVALAGPVTAINCNLAFDETDHLVILEAARLLDLVMKDEPQ